MFTKIQINSSDLFIKTCYLPKYKQINNSIFRVSGKYSKDILINIILMDLV